MRSINVDGMVVLASPRKMFSVEFEDRKGSGRRQGKKIGSTFGLAAAVYSTN